MQQALKQRTIKGNNFECVTKHNTIKTYLNELFTLKAKKIFLKLDITKKDCKRTPRN